MALLNISAKAALLSRLTRTGMLGHSFTGISEATCACLGFQARDVDDAFLALCPRLAERPSTILELSDAALGGTPPQLVRFYAQRDTPHLWPANRWQSVAVATDFMRNKHRSFSLVPQTAETCVKAALRAAGRYGLSLEELSCSPSASAKLWDVRVAARLLVKTECAAISGDRFVSREALLGIEESPASPTLVTIDSECIKLCRDYIRTFSPVSEHDIRYFFGVTAIQAHKWIKALGSKIVRASCGEEYGSLFALREDMEWFASLEAQDPPLSVVLTACDPILTALKDNGRQWWLVDKDTPKWEKNVALVLVKGKAVATWKHTLEDGHLIVTAEALPGTGKEDLTEAEHALYDWAKTFAPFLSLVEPESITVEQPGTKEPPRKRLCQGEHF